MTKNRRDRQHAVLSDSELDTLLAATDDELLDYVRASAHPQAGLMAIIATSDGKTADPLSSALRDPSNGDRVIATIEVRTLAGHLADAVDQAPVASLTRARGVADAIDLAHDGALGLASVLECDPPPPSDCARAADASALALAEARACIRAYASGLALALDIARDLADALDRAAAGDLPTAGDFSSALIVFFRDRDLDRDLDRVLDRALALDRAVTRDRDRDRALDRALDTFADDSDVALARGLARGLTRDLASACDLASDLASDLDIDLGPIRHLSTIQVDASGTDLSHGAFPDLSVLEGVVWTDDTIWPPGMAPQVLARSMKIRPGVYQVRGGSEREWARLISV